MKACRFDQASRRCEACGYVAPRLPLTRICRPPPAARAAEPATARPGDELHAILRDWLGIVPTMNCPCRKMAATMNALGPDWCEGDGLAEIVETMRAEHGKRWKAGQTRIPFVDAGARQLVRLACRRARDRAAGPV